MDSTTKHLISKGTGSLQISYAEYADLLEKVNEGKRLREIKNEVMKSLQAFLDQEPGSRANVVAPGTPAKPSPPPAQEQVESAEPVADKSAAKENKVEPPPIKKEIAKHFNAVDESGHLFDVFTQYYAALNDVCGGTAVVTIKDGVCSIWNYDEWAEFAYIDINNDKLRFALDTRYTNDLSSLTLCEVPRLLASRKQLVCVQTDELNKTLINVLARAFADAGAAKS